MFPEDDLRGDFWLFVYMRALDPRVLVSDDFEPDPAGSGLLNTLEERRDVVRYYLAQGDERPHEYEPGWPVAYRSLQDALLAYLITRMSSPGLGFPYDYATWLRTVVLVVVDAQRDPSLLKVTITVDEDGVPDPSGSQREERTMTLDGSWDCLSRDTFRTIRRAYSGLG